MNRRAGHPAGGTDVGGQRFQYPGILQVLAKFLAWLRNRAATTSAPLIALIVTLALGLDLFDEGTKRRSAV